MKRLISESEPVKVAWPLPCSSPQRERFAQPGEGDVGHGPHVPQVGGGGGGQGGGVHRGQGGGVVRRSRAGRADSWAKALQPGWRKNKLVEKYI